MALALWPMALALWPLVLALWLHLMAYRPLVVLLRALVATDSLEVPSCSGVFLTGFDTPDINHATPNVGDLSAHAICIFVCIRDVNHFADSKWVVAIVSQIIVGFVVLYSELFLLYSKLFLLAGSGYLC